MKGIYALIISLKKDKKIKIGSLGNLNFKKGIYIYIGSAQNNLEKRLARHKSKTKKLHWHIDYLLKHAKIIKVLTKKGKKSLECKTAQHLLKIQEPIKGFGCSDCKCISHLFKIRK